MTNEELQAELDELKGGNEALAKKNKELLGELKTARKSQGESEIGSDKFYALQDKFDDLTEQNKKLSHDLKGKDKDITKLTESNTGLTTNLQSVLIDGGLNDSLIKAGVKPEFMDATKALLKGQVSLVENKAMVGDKSLSDYVTDWGANDGKHFITAPENSGGGANGGDKQGGDKHTQKRGEMSHSEKGAFIKEHGESEYFKLAQ